MPEVEQKIWGTRRLLFAGNCVEVHLLKLRPDPETGKPVCCSWHKHEMKYNRFEALEGRLSVQMGGHVFVVSPGQPFVVCPTGRHRFVVTEPCTVVEFTWAEKITEDIHREDEGHVLDTWPEEG